MSKLLGKIMPLWLVEAFEHYALDHFGIAKFFLNNIDPEFLEIISRRKALVMFKHASKAVPAYKKFLIKQKLKIDEITRIDLFDALVPETDKDNYIREYHYEQRCINGKFPKLGNIDESSGSSGHPTNWIRALQEDDLLFKAARFEFNYVFGSNQKDYIILSAWSSGPWATGVKFCVIAEYLGLIKNTTEDIKNIVETLILFGPQYNYIIAGYPPFLKRLLEEAKISWKKYNVHFLTGGEGTVYGWNEYIQQRLKSGAKVVSSYGASDLDIGIGFETEFAHFIRGLAAKNKELRKALYQHEDRIPMVFQYNPSIHYIRSVVNEKYGKQEFHITLLDQSVASTKVKYNLHDEGGVHTFNTMLNIIENYEPQRLKHYMENNKAEILKLPFLYVVGRSDGTVSLDGANVYPEQITMAVHKNKNLMKTMNTFRMSIQYDKNKNIIFLIKINLKERIKPTKFLEKKYFDTIVCNLKDINSDFKESYLKDASVIKPKIILYPYEHKEFKKKKIKNKYIE